MTTSKKPSERYTIFNKRGSWGDIVEISEKIELVLSSLNSEDISADLSDGEIEVLANELKRLVKEWKKWRPQTKDSYSKEMRKKTADQASIGRGPLEKEGKEVKEEITNIGSSIKKGLEDTRKGDLKEASDQFSCAIKSTGKAMDGKVRPTIRKIEETTYKAVLKFNCLYFNTTLLNAIMSKVKRNVSSDTFELELHVNNSKLHRILEDRIDWDDS